MHPTSQRQRAKVAKTRRLILLFLAFPATVATFAMGLFIYKFHGRSLSTETGDWGTFGDFLGGIVNPIAGLVTIVLLVLTLRSQQDELEEQRRQLAKQAFDQSFFGWTSSYRELIAELQHGAGNEDDPRKEGVVALDAIIRGCALNDFQTKTLIEQYQAATKAEQDRLRSEQKIEAADRWKRVFSSNEPQLGALVRTLYSLLRWIDSHPNVSWAEKWDAVSILRARLSGPELRAIFFNGFLPEGRKFNEYVRRYALLDNLPLVGHNRIKLAMHLDLHPFERASFDSDLARTELFKSNAVEPLSAPAHSPV